MKNINKILLYIILFLSIIFATVIAKIYLKPSQNVKEESSVYNTDKEHTVYSDIIEYKGKQYIRNTYVKAILFIGVDNDIPMSYIQDAGYGGQADSIMLFAHDKARNSIKLLMIPRDTMTDIIMTDMSGNEIGSNKQHVTMAYSFGEGSYLSCEYTKKAVSDMLDGLSIDKYVAAKTKLIGVITDRLGGLKVKIPYSGMETINENWTVGETVELKGEDAKRFLRYRDTNESFSAIKRMDAHKEYILAFQDKFKSEFKKDNSLIDKIFEDTQDYICTDMQREEINELVRDLAQNESLLDENIYNLPGESVTTSLYDEFHYDKNKTKELILDMFYREK
jgi:hypothetical protein